MGVTSRTRIISVIYKECDKRDIENYRPISFLNLNYKISTATLKNIIKKTLDTIIGEYHLEVIKNRILLYTLSAFCYTKDVSNKLNKNLDRNFNFSAFHKFGYRDKLIHMVEHAYTNVQSQININGLLSGPFTLT